MRYCFYHTDLGQNAVFHNFALQIALIQGDRSTRALARCSYMAGNRLRFSKYYMTGSPVFSVKFHKSKELQLNQTIICLLRKAKRS